MNIARLAAEERYVLAAHHDQPAPEKEGAPRPPRRPRKGAPVFVFRPLRADEFTHWTRRIAAEDAEHGSVVESYLELARERLVRVEELTVDGEPYEHERHFDELDGRWLVELGTHIYARTRLSDLELGKSSSPSA